MTYKEIVTYIEEIPRFTRKHSLAHTREMLLFLGNPQNGKKIIHVAGTNGKGSTGAYLERVLIEAGYRVGRYSSPAVFDPQGRRKKHRIVYFTASGENE